MLREIGGVETEDHEYRFGPRGRALFDDGYWTLGELDFGEGSLIVGGGSGGWGAVVAVRTRGTTRRSPSTWPRGRTPDASRSSVAGTRSPISSTCAPCPATPARWGADVPARGAAHPDHGGRDHRLVEQMLRTVAGRQHGDVGGGAERAGVVQQTRRVRRGHGRRCAGSGRDDRRGGHVRHLGDRRDRFPVNRAVRAGEFVTSPCPGRAGAGYRTS